MSKLIYIDLETGGLDPKVNPITQLAFIIEIDGVEKERHDILIAQTENLDPEAMRITGYEAGSGIPEKLAYEKLIRILKKYVDPYDKRDKLYMVAYNGHAFDGQFLRQLFTKYNNPWYGAYFWNPVVDCMLIAMAFCIGQRHLLGDFKQSTVAKSLGIEVDRNKLHDALYDVELCRDIFRKLRVELGYAETV